jgi:hypothetical protein
VGRQGNFACMRLGFARLGLMDCEKEILSKRGMVML